METAMFQSDTASKPKAQRLRVAPILVGGIVTATAFTLGLDVVTGSIVGGLAYIATDTLSRRSTGNSRSIKP
jgi:hypothetical protein